MTRSILPVALWLILSAVCSAGAMAAPAQQTATLPPEVLDVEWQLVSLQPDGAAAEDTTGLGLTLTLAADGTAFGSGGCNRFTTGYTVGAGQSLTFSLIAGTLMFCEEPIGGREQRYFATLQAVSAYSLADGQLRLRSGANGELVYASGTPTELPSTGASDRSTKWMLLAALVLLGSGLLLRANDPRRHAGNDPRRHAKTREGLR